MATMTEEQQVFLEGLVKDMTLNLYVYALRAVSNRETAEDAVNDTLLIACRKIETLEASPNPQGWLMQTLKFVIQNKKKSIQRQELWLADAVAAEGTLTASLCGECDLDTAGAEILGAEDYAVFRRFTLKEITAQEAAREWCCSVAASNKRLQRMRKKLQEALGKDCVEMS